MNEASARVAVIGTLRFPPEGIDEVLPHLRALVEATYRQQIARTIPTDPVVGLVGRG